MAAKRKPRAKTAAKTEGTNVRTINGKAVDLKNYVKAKAAGGGVSYHNGDEIAEKLAGKDIDAVYAHAAKALKVDESELRGKYKHLNIGMQRMSLGNRMRKGQTASA